MSALSAELLNVPRKARGMRTKRLEWIDRTLFDLLFPDRTSHYDQQSVDEFLAEAHGLPDRVSIWLPVIAQTPPD